jgi:tripartite-type tricarboxylate transporter receptor subunit TctC
LVGGQEVQLAFIAGTLSLPHVSAGRLRAIGLANKTPSPLAPGIPLITESGVPGFEFIQLLAIFAPAKTPVARINLLSQEIRRALETKEVKDRLLTIGLEAKGSTPQEFAALLKSEIAKWGKLVKDLDIKG